MEVRSVKKACALFGSNFIGSNSAYLAELGRSLVDIAATLTRHTPRNRDETDILFCVLRQRRFAFSTLTTRNRRVAFHEQ